MNRCILVVLVLWIIQPQAHCNWLQEFNENCAGAISDFVSDLTIYSFADATENHINGDYSYSCTNGYINTIPDPWKKKCHATWSHSLGRFNDAKWFGRDPRCIWYTCVEPSEYFGSLESYSCDANQAQDKYGRKIGYAIGTKCSVTCSVGSSSSTAQLECVGDPSYEAPMAVQDENYDKGRWIVSNNNCAWPACNMLALRYESDCYLLETVVGNKCHSYCVEGDKPLVPWEMFFCKLFADGTSNWEPTPSRCADQNAPDNCGPYPEEIKFFRCTDYYYVGSICEFFCDSTQQRVGSTIVKCQTMPNGIKQWKPNSGIADEEIGKCEDLLCPGLSGLHLISCNNGRKLDSLCTYRCPHMAPGAISMVCRYDPDSGLVHKAIFTFAGNTCEFVVCPDLDPSTLTTETTMSCTNEFYKGSECSFSCPAEFHVNTTYETMKCIDTDGDNVGEWDVGATPNCVHTTCSVLNPSILPENLLVSCSDSNYGGSVCDFSCSEGYTVDGSVTNTKCTGTDGDNDGIADWSNSLPQCIRIQCLPEYSFLHKGSVNCTDSNFYGSYCYYTCDYSHRVIGAQPAVCMDPDNDGIGNWNESMPICEKYHIPDPPDCPENLEPAQGSMICSDDRYFGSVCTFYCDPGFVLFGTNELECLEKQDGTGDWTDMFPICLTYLGECMVAISDPDHGNVTCSGKNYVTSECTYACDDGYHVVGDKVLVCEDTDLDGIGEWGASPSICFPDVVRCEPLHMIPDNGSFACSNNNIKDSSCTFTCDNGYYVDGSSISQCGDDDNDGIGLWSSPTPSCRMITCDAVDPTDLSRETQYSCTNENYGDSECEFSCAAKFTLGTGTSKIMCLDVDASAEGKWSDDIPTCVAIACDFDADLLDSATVYSCTDSNYLDSVCEFSCPSGMKLTTVHSDITCQDIDGDEIGLWNRAIPDCDYILCPELVIESDTLYSCTQLNHANSVCEFQCNVGMKLDNGVNKITCEDLDSDGTGDWSNTAPDCIYIICPTILPTDLSPETVYSCSNANLGNSQCTFSCTSHMRLDRTVESVSCVDENGDGVGEWTDELPFCVHTCSPPLVAPTYGSYECNDLNRMGSVCAFRCENGYVLTHVNVIICGMNAANNLGEWKGTEPKCEPYQFVCPLLSSFELTPDTEALCTNGNNRDSRCTFNCPEDLELRPNVKIIHCVDIERDGIGEWSPDPPICRRKSCTDENAEIKHGQASCTAYNAIGSQCSYECNPGFYLDPPYSTFCQEDGFWNTSIPICKPGKCYPDLKDMFSNDADCYGDNDPGAECDIKCSPTSKYYGEKAKYVCGNRRFRDGAGFWDNDILSCAGCGSGLLDIIFVLDGSANWPIWDFSDVKDWIPKVLYRVRKVINYGALWMSLAVLGSRESRCNELYSIPKFKMEMTFQYRTLEGIRRRMINVKQIGGCAHVGHGLTEALEYVERFRRPYVTSIMVLVLGGGSYDSASDVLVRINGSDIPVIGIAKGEDAQEFFQTHSIPTYSVSHPEDYEYISADFLEKIVKYDCRVHSLCSGPIAHGHAICKVKKEGHVREVCNMHCDRNYLLVGPDVANCGDLNNDGKMEWLSPHGTCKLIKCPALEQPDDLEMVCSNQNLYASTCQFSCKNGLHMIGLSELYCGDPGRLGIGRWNSEIPTCVQYLKCLPILLSPEFGTMVCTDENAVGSRCTIHCDHGYKLVGSGDILCQDSGKAGQVSWSSAPPVCEGCSHGNCEKDIVVLLDTSSSVTNADLKWVKDSIVEILEGVKGELDTGISQVGLIQYSGKSSFLCSSDTVTLEYKIELELGFYPFRKFKEAIAALPRLGRCTATGQAVSLVTKHFKTLGRQSVHWVLVLLTDARSNDDVAGPIQGAKAAGITIIPIGIGSFNLDQLRMFSEKVFTVANYSELSKVADEVKFQILSLEDTISNSAMTGDVKLYPYTFLIATCGWIQYIV